jgi:hypothetical protein
VAIESSTYVKPLISVAIDAVADASLVAQRDAEAEERACHACDAPLEGEPGGRGLFMWSRGDELRFEEPSLCDRCAVAIGMTALSTWAVEEEEG